MAKDLLNLYADLLIHLPLDLANTHPPVSTSIGRSELLYEIHISPEMPNKRNTEMQQRAI